MLEKVIFWDPVCDGAEYLEKMTKAHGQYLRNIRFHRRLKRSARIAGGSELLGSIYSETALREMKELSISPIAAAKNVPIEWLDVDRDCGWTDIGRLEQILSDAGISNALVKMVRTNNR
jgi:hypothetical protein